MNIMFMGTPDFAEKSLRKLIEKGFKVTSVVSQPDKQKGRGHKVCMTPVKEYALSQNIEVYQPTKLKDGSFIEVLDRHKPDIIVVAAYGRILPEYIINYPKYGCINVHASLLPEYRGAAPIQRAVIDGKDKTGVTIMQMDTGLDTGDILMAMETDIGEYETSGELFDRLADIGGELLCGVLYKIEKGEISPRKQDNSKATYAKMIEKGEAQIDWTKSEKEVSKLICGMSPSPSAFTYYNGETVKIIEAEKIEYSGNEKPGCIIGYKKNDGLMVKCGENAIKIKVLQTAGKRKMSVDDYVNGKGVPEGMFEYMETLIK